MSETKIAVVIPVGPKEHHAAWLGECLDSLAAQTRSADLLVMVDDMAAPGALRLSDGGPADRAVGVAGSVGEVSIVFNEWRLGVAASFNVGVARAFARGADLAFMQGADDTFEIGCLAEVVKAYEANRSADGYYWCDVRYSDGREDQALPCNIAAVTPGLWRETGGFSPEMGAGAPDAAFISCLLVHWPAALVRVGGGVQVVHRIHDQQETNRRAPLDGLRDWITRTYQPARWGRSS